MKKFLFYDARHITFYSRHNAFAGNSDCSCLGEVSFHSQALNFGDRSSQICKESFKARGDWEVLEIVVSENLRKFLDLSSYGHYSWSS